MSSPPQNSDSQASPDDVLRLLNFLVREYCSFVNGFAALLDGVDRWRHAAPPEEAERWDLLRRQAMTLLVQHGIRPTACVGQPVDLRYHQVMNTEQDGSVPVDTVTRVLEMGYEMMILGQAPIPVRSARVVVAARVGDGEMVGPRIAIAEPAAE